MSSVQLPPPPQPAYLTDQSFQSSNLLASSSTSIHPLQHLPEQQQHQQQQQQQQYHNIPQQPTFHDDQDQEDEASQVAQITSVNRAVEMAIHGIQAFVSLYSVSSIISAIRFQAAHKFTSLTAWFLFLVTGVSFLMASTYILLAWWSRTSRGLDRIKAYLQAGDTKRTPAPWVIRTTIFLISIRTRMGILLAMTVTTLLAAVMQQFKIRNSSNCNAFPVPFRHFCRTTKAAVTSAFMSCFFWGVWFAYWFYMTYYKNRSQKVLERQHSRQHGEVLISMPDDEEYVRANKDRELRSSEMSEVRAENGSTVAPVPHPQPYQDLSGLHQHDQENQPASSTGSQCVAEKDIQEAFRHISIGVEGNQDPDPNSLGLGIDLHKQFNLDSTEVASGNEYIGRAGSISGSSIGHGSIAPSEVTSSDVPERSRSERMRDHAKIFSKARSSTGSIHEACSNRNTPLLYSRELVQISPAISPNMSTPTTPLSRGEIGYMGNRTIKALHTVPRSASMGYIAAFNNMTAHSAAASVQASPVGAISFDFAGTPISVRSQSFAGSSYLPIPADAAAAEQSMDEHLKAVRRRSFAAEAGTGSMILNMDDLLSNSDPANPPNEVDSSSRSNFRMSFSTPNLSNFRRKSSLGLMSVLNSLVTSPASDSVSDVSSDASSPRSILSNEGHDTDSVSLSQQSNISGGGDGVSVSAQDLLQLEYGEIFAALQRSHSALTLTDLNNPLTMHPYSAPGSGAPSIISRRRSGSVSSSHTSHSTSTTRTNSSESSSSTASTLTGSISGEDKARACSNSKLPRPPLSFVNRILVGSHHSHLHTRGNKQHHQNNHLAPEQAHNPHHPQHDPLRRGGSSGNLSDIAYHDDAFKQQKKQGRSSRSGCSVPIPRKFPSHGDLTQYSWDYRKEVCN
ncbi:hypothetical protein BGZ82_000779 [Podila clonocystis]|nr:hypothetical protein BGZ82_000779 [Podila clonocystis]